MENSLTIREFNTILSSNMENAYEKINTKIFNVCVNTFSDVRLTISEIDCIKKYTSLYHDTFQNTNNYFYNKLKK
jgi:hypothetical protein